MKCLRVMGSIASRARGAMLALFLGAMLAGPAHAVPPIDSKGTDFWLMDIGNYHGGPDLTMFITGDVNTSGVVTIPGLAFVQPFSVVANTVTSVPIPTSADIQSSDVVESRGIHVTALDEVTVYGLSRIPYTTDAYLGLPTDALKLDYIVLGYANVEIVEGTEFGVVGTANGTTVTITPSVTTGPRTAGVPYNITLNQGDTYQLRNTSVAGDLSGTIVTSDQPVGVFGGHECANIPRGYVACDHVCEELPPTSTWGTSFITVPLATRLKGDTFRFLAQANGTIVNINGAPVATLSRGQFWEQIVAGGSEVTSNEPILVAQYSNCSSYDGVTSDPFMMLVPPTKQYLGSYTVTTPASGFTINYINLVVPNAAVGAVRVDGLAVPPGSYTAIGAAFSGAQVLASPGSHNLDSTVPLPFGVFVYGFADYDSYGYPGGMLFTDIANVTSVALEPKTATNQVNAQHCVTAKVLDQFSQPMSGIRVDFDVTGANPTSGFRFTDASGQAQFCYVGTNRGTDQITASAADLSDDATKEWISNRDPVCINAAASEPDLWPPDHSYRAISILGVTDPDGDPITITVTGVMQDEPVNGRGDGETCPDAQIVDGQASVRAERSGTPGVPGNGRVYVISFTATDGQGGSCDASVSVCVPHDQGDPTCVNDGQRYNSRGPCNGRRDLAPESVSLSVARVTASQAEISFGLPADTQVNVSVYDVIGRRLATIENGSLVSGTYSRVWNMDGVSRGLYFVRMHAGAETLTQRVLKTR